MDRTNLGDNFCETNTNEFHERTNLTYSKRTCQLIKHFEHFPNCSMGEFIGINIRGNLELPCKPKNIMECNKVSPHIREQMLVLDLYVFTLKFHSNFSL